MDGGMLVVKVTTGIHLIKDIGVNVGHDRPEFISADKVLASKDLHTDLGAHVLFRLDSPMPYKVVPVVEAKEALPIPVTVSAPVTRTSAVERENEQLKEALASMQKSMTSMEKMLTEFIKAAPTQVQVVQASPQKAVAPAEEVVEIDTPMFIPDFTPQEIVGKISTTSETSDGGAIAGATSKLRELRKGK